jgi:hypothetical protein
MKLAYSTPQKALHAWLGRIMYSNGDNMLPNLNVYSAKRKVFADGFVMYSYGTHFPLVRWIPEYGAFTLNVDRYSNTTSNHQQKTSSLVRGYASALGYRVRNSEPLREMEVFRLSYHAGWLPEVQGEDIIKYYHDNIRMRALKAKRARTNWSRTFHFDQAEGWIAECNRFCSTFAKTLDNSNPELPEDVQASLVLLKLREQ